MTRYLRRITTRTEEWVVEVDPAPPKTPAPAADSYPPEDTGVHRRLDTGPVRALAPRPVTEIERWRERRAS